jgi:arginyl-tRNA--protein-N-Asp/Glu arginylyltransferase
MNKPSTNRVTSLVSYLTPPHPCSYLPERYATNQFISPDLSIDAGLYSRLIELGFRRSGDYVYRPRCFGCEACIPARIPVSAFTPNRSQRRNWRDNQHLKVISRPAVFNDEHFELYRRYLSWRHDGGGMDNPSPRDYMGFLTSRRIDTRFYELRDGHRLVGVAVVDCLPDSFSAVYTFYDPEYRRCGIGVFAILWQIAEARRLGIPWIYLGYWIHECSKMRYKGRFHPLEVYRRGRWLLLDRNSPISH